MIGPYMEWKWLVLIWKEDYGWSLFGMKMIGPYMERRLWQVLIWNEDNWSLFGKKIVICHYNYMEWRCWFVLPYLEWWFVLKSWWQQEMKEDKEKFYRKGKRKRRKEVWKCLVLFCTQIIFKKREKIKMKQWF